MNRIIKHIREGFLGVIRHFAMSLSSISSVTVTLMIMAFFLILSVNIDAITYRLEEAVQIHVLIDKEVEDEEQITLLQENIKEIEGVAQVEFSDKDAEFEAWIKNVGDENAEEIYGEYRGENNPMLNAFIVNAKTGADLKQISNDISANEGIQEVNYGGDSSTVFLSSLESLRNAGFIIVIALGFIAVFLISNTIRVSIHSRRKEISIMRTVGATNWYIRWPFIIEGMLIGLLGSAIPIVATIFGYQYLFDITGGFLLSKMFTLVEVFPIVYEVSAVLAIIGMTVGAIGSTLSVGKQLRWSR